MRVVGLQRIGIHAIDLFSLYVLFSQYRSSDNTLENCFFQISSYSRAYVRIIYEKTKSQVPLRPLLGKQNIQAKKVYSSHFETIQDSREVKHFAENGRKLKEFPFPRLSHPSLTIVFCSSSRSIPVFVCCLDCEATSQLGGEKGSEFVLNRKGDAK